jgi:hypothetical protein
MAKFITIEYQSGGCDYTIGCGVRVSDPFEADSLQAAFEHYVASREADYLDELYYNPWEGDEYTPDEAEIWEVTNYASVDIPRLRQAFQDKINAAKETEKEAEEKAELKRLQEKYKDG